MGQLNCETALPAPEKLRLTDGKLRLERYTDALVSRPHAGSTRNFRSQADCLVAGDKDLLSLGTFRKTAIVSPAAYLEFQ